MTFGLAFTDVLYPRSSVNSRKRIANEIKIGFFNLITVTLL